jgi:hypothetical protein
MSRWTHAICDVCWVKREPGRQPFQIGAGLREKEKCCFCGKPTWAGIYIRTDPESLLCQGFHKRREEAANGRPEGS